MIYVYNCEPCKASYEVIKRASEIERPEPCPSCQGFGVREFVPRNLYFNKTQVTHAEYNPGLGCVVENAHHKSEILKQRGLVEVGNDYGSGEKQQATFEQARTEKREREWDAL